MLIDETIHDIDDYGYFVDIEKNIFLSTNKEENEYECSLFINKEFVRERSNDLQFKNINDGRNIDVGRICNNAICTLFVCVLCWEIWLV